MIIRPIRSPADHAKALEAVAALIEADPAPGSDDADRLEVLAMLVERYEEQRFAIDHPSPIEAIRFRMDQQGLKAKDLVPALGAASRVSEVMSGKRTLSLAMIRALNEQLGIPVAVLVGSHRSATQA